MTSIGILQLVSPALPVGAFSYSEGLEWLVQTKKITNGSSLSNWIESELLRGQIRIETAAQASIRNSLINWQKENDQKSISELYEWNSWLLSLRDSKEIRNQLNQMGKSLLQLLLDLEHPLPNNNKNFSWPIAWAYAGLIWNLTEIEVVEGYLYSWIANQLSAGVRLIPIGSTEAQKIQFHFLPKIKFHAKKLICKDPKKIWTGDVGATMAQISHKELYSRLFQS